MSCSALKDGNARQQTAISLSEHVKGVKASFSDTVITLIEIPKVWYFLSISIDSLLIELILATEEDTLVLQSPVRGRKVPQDNL